MSKILPDPNSKVAQDLVQKGHPWIAAGLEALRLAPKLLLAIGVVMAIHFHKPPDIPKISLLTVASK